MDNASPPPHPASAARTLASTLRLVVLVQSLGLLWTAWVAGSDVESFLFGTYHWSDRATFLLDRAVAVALAGVAVAGLFRPMRAGYVAMAAWYLAIPLARWSYGGVPFEELSVGAHAVRWAAPLAIALLAPAGPLRAGAAAAGEARASASSVAWILRCALAATFVVHGFEALSLHPRFVDYLLLGDRRLVSVGLDQSAAEAVLRVIGIVDIACAAWVLRGRLHRGVLAYMAFWGAITAGARIVHSGEHGIHLALIRAANAGVPLALCLAAPALPRDRLPLSAAAALLRWIGGRRVAVAVAACLAMGGLGLNLVASGQTEGLAPRQLRLVWAEEPSVHARLSWTTTDEGSAHTVYYDTVPRGGEPAAYAHSATSARTGRYDSSTPYYHHVELEGLSPSTTYYFVVETDGHHSEERHFVTAPADDRPFKLLYGGDSRSSSTNRRAMNQRMAQLVTADDSIVALAHGGDYIAVGDDWSQWDEWLDDHQLTTTEAGRVLPVIATRGNHEGDGVLFNRVFGFPGGDEVDYYATHLGANVTLITLDSNSSQGGDQRDWLEAQLMEAQSRRWIVPGYHRPAYPAVKTPGGALEHWVPLFETYEVDLVCESDGHVLKRTVPIRDGSEAADGIVYVGEGGLGVSQRTPVDHWYLDAPGMSSAAHHVQLLSFTPEELRYQAISLEAEVLDEYVATPRREGAAPPPVDPDPDPVDPPAADGGTPPPTTDPADAGTSAPMDPDLVEPRDEPGFRTVHGGCSAAGDRDGALPFGAILALGWAVTLARRSTRRRR